VPSIDDNGFEPDDLAMSVEAAEPAGSSDLLTPSPPAQWPPTPIAPDPDAEIVDVGLTLEAYEEFDDETTPTATARPGRLVEEVLAIISAEGPVLGGQRVGRLIAQALDRILANAARRGLVIEEDPLSEGDRQHRTYRLPHQPAVRQRTLGPRTLELVPPSELASLMEALQAHQDWSTHDALYREVLHRYGLKRLTPKTLQRLNAVKAQLVP
jgi:hypothetical protein